jgi:hypothetical protein
MRKHVTHATIFASAHRPTMEGLEYVTSLILSREEVSTLNVSGMSKTALNLVITDPTTSQEDKDKAQAELDSR